MTKNLGNKKPFNNFEMPVPGALPNNLWFRRHIIFDQPAKTVYIQVLWDASTGLKREEIRNIKAGLWAQYLPPAFGNEDYGKVIAECVMSGYSVAPIAVVGGAYGEMHAIMQIIDPEDAIRIVVNNHMKPISEGTIDLK